MFTQDLLDFKKIEDRTQLWYDERFDLLKCPHCGHIYLYWYGNGFIYAESTLTPEVGLDHPSDSDAYCGIICVQCGTSVPFPTLVATRPTFHEVLASPWSELLDQDKLRRTNLP